MASLASFLSLMFMLGIIFRSQVLGLISVNPKSPTSLHLLDRSWRKSFSPTGLPSQRAVLDLGKLSGVKGFMSLLKEQVMDEFNLPKRTILRFISGMKVYLSPNATQFVHRCSFKTKK